MLAAVKTAVWPLWRIVRPAAPLKWVVPLLICRILKRIWRKAHGFKEMPLLPPLLLMAMLTLACGLVTRVMSTTPTALSLPPLVLLLPPLVLLLPPLVLLLARVLVSPPLLVLWAWVTQGTRRQIWMHTERVLLKLPVLIPPP
jgi:hypothetical protein